MSSPLYEGDVLSLSQEDLQVMDEIEAKLSQSSSSPSRRKLPSEDERGRAKRARLIADALSQNNDPCAPGGSSQGLWGGKGDSGVSATDKTGLEPGPSFVSSFQRASYAQVIAGGPQDNPAEADFSSFFNSGPPMTALFQTAKSASPSFHPPTLDPSSFSGFMKSSTKGGLLAPSAVALAKAEARMKRWREEEEEENNAPTFSTMSSSNHLSSTPGLPVSPPRPALRALQNQHSPATPTPAGSNSMSFLPASSMALSKGKGKSKQFKSPLLAPVRRWPPRQATASDSPLNPRSQHAGLHHTNQPSTSSRPFASPMHATASHGVSSTRLRHTPAKFKTPFKDGVRPPQVPQALASTPLPQINVAKPSVDSVPTTSTSTPSKPPKRTFFDLNKTPNRRTLASSGLLPQSYSLDDLQALGINPLELSQMTPSIALYYTFHTTSGTPALIGSQVSASLMQLGPATAFEELLARGCSLATKTWVENHWSLILWKLAGMVALEPEKESDPTTKRWCWQEVIRQLLYRYERELNGGSRPPLRLISTQDSPASCPMILCVSDIKILEPRAADEGLPTPELEVTDGWYRLRAQVDEPLARAIRKGIIKVGRKIEVAGARLASERKDPMEILEAYQSVSLVISGNSSHLAPWHAKLGFQQVPSVATLHSLTHDGGPVAVMDVVVTKTYPIAYLEFLEGEDGEKYREGPRTEVEEAAAVDKWKRLRDVEASKLKVELEKRVARYESYADRLERKAGPHFPPVGDDGPPDGVEILYDELEDPGTANDVFANIRPHDAGWLACVIRERLVKGHDEAATDMERDLNHTCPPREVRNFRVIEVQDARTRRRPGNRTAQLTVWDVLSLTFAEGGEPGSFQPGQRFRVTNLMPSQPGAWMDCEAGSVVYLSTRKDSRWTKLKAGQ